MKLSRSVKVLLGAWILAMIIVGYGFYTVFTSPKPSYHFAVIPGDLFCLQITYTNGTQIVLPQGIGLTKEELDQVQTVIGVLC